MAVATAAKCDTVLRALQQHQETGLTAGDLCEKTGYSFVHETVRSLRDAGLADCAKEPVNGRAGKRRYIQVWRPTKKGLERDVSWTAAHRQQDEQDEREFQKQLRDVLSASAADQVVLLLDGDEAARFCAKRQQLGLDMCEAVRQALLSWL